MPALFVQLHPRVLLMTRTDPLRAVPPSILSILRPPRDSSVLLSPAGRLHPSIRDQGAALSVCPAPRGASSPALEGNSGSHTMREASEGRWWALRPPDPPLTYRGEKYGERLHSSPVTQRSSQLNSSHA